MYADLYVYACVYFICRCICICVHICTWFLSPLLGSSVQIILIHLWLVWGVSFVDKASKLEGRVTNKWWRKSRVFCVLASSANLPTRGRMVDFLVNLALSLSSQTFQKSSQAASKIKKSIEVMMQVGLGLAPLLVRFGLDFGAKLVCKLGPS